MKPRIGWWFATVVLGLALSPVLVLAQGAQWQANHDAGWQAFQAGRLDEAEKLLRAAEKEARGFAASDPRLATTLDHLAWVLCAEGKYAEAEPLAKSALAWREKALGPEHPDVVKSLNTLACLYDAEGKLDQAKPLYERGLSLAERSRRPGDPGVAAFLDNLATIAHVQGKNAEAEAFYKRALAVREKAPGAIEYYCPMHPNIIRSESGHCPICGMPLAKRKKETDLAPTLHNLGTLYLDQGKFAEAEPLFKQVLNIREKSLGPEHPDVATSLEALGALYAKQGKHAEAETYLKRALAIYEKTLGPDHPHVARCCAKMGLVCCDQGRNDEADSCCNRAVTIYEKAGSDPAGLAKALDDYASVLRKTNRAAEAEKVEARARAIREKQGQPAAPK
ncbi:MAG TPA: tetratricopeptide repeat protein [Isosphaeraceae bacterium]|nr:tetratricopeptide repeat protein [Isosphaeraceae bacterium]